MRIVVLLAIVIVVAGGLVGLNYYDHGRTLGRIVTQVTGQCRHKLPPTECPFCTPALVEELGMCTGHGVPEALCWRCNRKLTAAFKIEGDWCGEHRMPESLCTICKGAHAGHNHAPGEGHGSTAETVGGHTERVGALECTRHKLPERACPFCDPGVIVARGMCAEHEVPEALCWKCDPRLVAAFRAEEDWCDEHLRPESLCPICTGTSRLALAEARIERARAARGPAPSAAEFAGTPRSQRAPAEACKTEQIKVVLASTDTVRQAGLVLATAQRRALQETIAANVELAYDGNRYAQLSSRVAGVIHEVRADLGERVRSGDVLAIIDSPELAAAKGDYLQALASVALLVTTVERERELLKSGIATERDVQESATRLAEARIAQARAEQRLRTLGLGDETLRAAAESKEPGSRLPLVAPFDGEIVERAAVVGESVDTTRGLFWIADTSQMWALLDIADAGAPVQVGRTVRVFIDALGEDPIEGRVNWVSTRIDARTRTLKARATLANPDGRLRANLFGRGEIDTGDDAPVLVVPRSAVQWDGCCNVVFVPESETTFAPRKVRLGRSHAGLIEVREGLREGERVVTTGSFLLKTEILKGEIGAGCCPEDIGKKK
jgi:cobalt-zinc-cadmium efflux system membrane fusion protein